MARTKNPSLLIKQLAGLRERISKKNAEADELKAKRDELEQLLIAVLKKAGTPRVNNGAYTASLTKRVLPTVTDWDEFYEFIKDNDAMFMLERRPSSTAYRDMLESRDGEAIPGVESFEKETISLRSSS